MYTEWVYLPATRFINLLTICIAVLSHAACKDSFSRILMLGSNFNRMSIKRCKDVCMSMTYYLRSICLPIVSSTRILMSFFNSSHISSVMADDVLAHVIYDFSFLSRFFFYPPAIYRLLLNRSTCPTFAYNRYNEPSCSMGCDIENKEDRHKNIAHAVPVYFSYLCIAGHTSFI